jgi:ATP-dependent Clp protease adaptor protein ClpS
VSGSTPASCVAEYNRPHPMSGHLDPRESTLTESRQERKVARPTMWRVLLHNDDYTTQEFVVWILETIFRKHQAEAVSIMLSVHRSGLGIAGVYTHDVATTKMRAAREAAEAHEFPLLVTIEPDPLSAPGTPS